MGERQLYFSPFEVSEMTSNEGTYDLKTNLIVISVDLSHPDMCHDILILNEEEHGIRLPSFDSQEHTMHFGTNLIVYPKSLSD